MKIMKYVILVCDGAADWPDESLGWKTVLEVAKTPSMDWISTNGQMGLLKTIPDGSSSGSGVANMTILGYQPEKDFTGRGPFEALSAGVDLKENDIVFRCNIINIQDGVITDYSSGHISTAESKPLIDSLQDHFYTTGANFSSGVQYRHILLLDGNNYSSKIHLVAPHDQIGQPYKDFLVTPIDPYDVEAKRTATYLNHLIEESYETLANHSINKQRAIEGKIVANYIWPWGMGTKPKIESFKNKYGLEGAVISAVDLIFGIGIAAGLEPIHVEGATGLPDTNYQGKVTAALEQLKMKDFVYLHIEAIDEMAHSGDPQKKIAAIEDFDREIVKPFIEAEKEFNNELVIVILPDHPTPCEIRTHSNDPVPFALYNPQKEIGEKKLRLFSEKSGKEGELGLIEDGHEFMKLILSQI